MGWDAILSPLASSVALVFLPGVVIGLLGRLRLPLLIGAAPALSLAVIGLAATLAPVAGMDWSLQPVVAVTGALCLPASLIGVLIARSRWSSGTPDQPWSRAAFVSAIGIGFVVALAAVLPGLARPDALSQTYDAVFHYNAVRYVLDSANASPFHIGTMTAPSQDLRFYPGAWHALTALVTRLSGADIVVASNAVSITIAGLAWPASSLLLVRQVLGGRPSLLVAAGALSGAFSAFPTQLLSFGVLWPNALAYAALPAALSMVIGLAGLASANVASIPQAVGVLVLSLVGLGFAHPNALFALAVLAMPPVILGSWRFSRQTWTARRRFVSLLPWIGVTATVVTIDIAVNRSRMLGDVSAVDWPARMTISQAFGEVVLQSTLSERAAWIIAVLAVIGMVVAARDRRLRWLPLSYAGASALYLLAAGADSELSLTLTGPWYNDSYRLAALLPILSLPLAVMGVCSLARVATVWLAEHLPAQCSPLYNTGITVSVVTAAVLTSTSFGYLPTRVAILKDSYTFSADHQQSPLLTTDEYELLQDLPRVVPAGVGVAGNPWDGSALVYALADRWTPFPHLIGSWDESRKTIAARLRFAASDPEVCAALRELGIGYAVDGGPPLRDRPLAKAFPGIDRLGSVTGFERVASGGTMVLYEITACG